MERKKSLWVGGYGSIGNRSGCTVQSAEPYIMTGENDENKKYDTSSICPGQHSYPHSAICLFVCRGVEKQMWLYGDQQLEAYRFERGTCVSSRCGKVQQNHMALKDESWFRGIVCT